MDIFKKFATDTEAELKGVWRDLSDSCRILVARWNNENFNDRLAELQEQHAEALATANAKEKERQFGEIITTVMVETVLLDWKGVEKDGEPLEYSKTAARELLKLRDFRDLVRSLAQQQEAYLLHKQTKAGNA